MNSTVLIILGLVVVLVVVGGKKQVVVSSQTTTPTPNPTGQQNDSPAAIFADVVNAMAAAINATVNAVNTNTQRN
jgi:hypothetical protein